MSTNGAINRKAEKFVDCETVSQQPQNSDSPAPNQPQDFPMYTNHIIS
jgi:hypothetical protein